MLTLEQRNYFKPGDEVEFFGPNLEPTTIIIPKEIYNEKGELIEAANHPQMTVKFNVNVSLKPFDMMRIKMFDISSFM
jgi:putative protease